MILIYFPLVPLSPNPRELSFNNEATFFGPSIEESMLPNVELNSSTLSPKNSTSLLKLQLLDEIIQRFTRCRLLPYFHFIERLGSQLFQVG